MSFFSIKQIERTRKPSRCYWCNELIQFGEPKITTATVWEGDFCANNFHPECWERLEKWQSQTGEEAWPDMGAYQRGSTLEKGGQS